MKDPEQTRPFPLTLHEWEQILTRALLRADGDVANSIRSFEITPETLAEHCGLGPEYASGAENAFRQALKSDPDHLYRSLQNGTARAPTIEVPNCMALLTLSLLVDSLLDGAYEDKGQYREKLAQWLGFRRSFTDLRGISTMWKRLVAWLEERIVAGDRYRRLILPEPPPSWTHIGFTRYLSFPTRRDIALLRKLIEKSPTAAEDLAKLVALLDQQVNASSVSLGMQMAFFEFRKAFRAGTASADHRFWRLVMRARALSGHTEGPTASLRMEFDEDGGRYYRVTIAGAPDAWVPSIGSAASLKHLQASPNLGPAARRGALFFRSCGLASWSASGEPPVGIGPFHVAVADRHLRLASGGLVSFEQTGMWHVTRKPVPASTLNDILKRLGMLASNNTVRTIALVDGVHVGRGWLGQPRYLPVVDGAVGEIRVTKAGGASGLTCVNGVLTASAPIDGEFTIGNEGDTWCCRASFFSLAEVHVQLSEAAYRLPEQVEWQPGGGRARAANCGASEPAWDEAAYQYQDMVEAIYASARSGIAEVDLVGLIARVADDRKWDMLRTLQESTFIDARPREYWRGRTFTLGQPTLTDIRIDGQPSVLVSGALPTRLEADFRETVALQGGRAFRRLASDSMAPPLLGAAGVSAAKLAGALGWVTGGPLMLPDGPASNRLLETSVRGESYDVPSEWDWSKGRFRSGGVASGPVSLKRLVHPGRRADDIYRVNGARQRSFASRHAAILDAHQQACRPLFRLADDRLLRITEEGALPLEIAKALRLRTLANGGASGDGWAYKVALPDVHWLSDLLPGIIEGATPPTVESALSYRRRRGARRPIWTTAGTAV